MMNVRKVYNLMMIFVLIGILFISNGAGYACAFSSDTLRATSLFQDEERVDQLLRYMYGDHEHPGKGVIVYRKDTPEEKGAQVVLPVYEISWIMDNFSEKELQAVIDALKRWKNPVHGKILKEIIDILNLKNLPLEEIAKMAPRGGLALLSKIMSELGENSPYRIYFAISRSEIGEVEQIEVEGFVEVLSGSYTGVKYDAEVAVLEIRGAREGKERFIGLARQLLRYTAWRELQLGSKRVKFRLVGIASELQENEGFDAQGLYEHDDLEDFVLKGVRKTIESLESGDFFGGRKILDEVNRIPRRSSDSSL